MVSLLVLVSRICKKIMESKKLIRIVLTLAVVLAGSYYINRSTSLSEILSTDVVKDAKADVPSGK